MATWLKQSTAVEIKLGPFVSSSDGFTWLYDLFISFADTRLAKNGGDWGQKHEETPSAAYEENGWYSILLDATDTNTLGCLIVAVNESGALPVWREFMVMPANTFDSLVTNGSGLNVNLQSVNGTTVTGSGTGGDPWGP